MSIAESVQRRLVRALDADELLELDTSKIQNVGKGESKSTVLSDAPNLWPNVEQSDEVRIFYHKGTDSYVVRKVDK